GVSPSPQPSPGVPFGSAQGRPGEGAEAGAPRGAAPAPQGAAPPSATAAQSPASALDVLELKPAPRADEGEAVPAILPSAVLGLFPMANQGLLRDMQAMAGGEPLAGP